MIENIKQSSSSDAPKNRIINQDVTSHQQLEITCAELVGFYRLRPVASYSRVVYVPNLNIAIVSNKASSLKRALSPGLGEEGTKAFYEPTVADYVGDNVHSRGALEANEIFPTE